VPRRGSAPIAGGLSWPAGAGSSGAGSSTTSPPGYDVARVGRDGPDARWSDAAAVTRAVEGAALVVNLAGKSVGCRYHDRNREEILRSRVATTRQLREAIAAAEEPPPLWLNAGTATIYRYALDRPQTESDGELGTGFSVDVARSWERELFAGDLPGTRRVALRMAIVLGGPATDTLAPGWAPAVPSTTAGGSSTGATAASGTSRRVGRSPFIVHMVDRSSPGSTSTTSWPPSGSSRSTPTSTAR
jgi:hypothetical protein